MSWSEIFAFLIFTLVIWDRWHRQCRLKIPSVAEVKPSLPENPPLVSVILPARNEAHQIEPYLHSILNQDYPHLEVVVVDDCSEDATAEILQKVSAGNSRMVLVRGIPVPEGWMGKAHAMFQGYRAAKGEWLLFTDAHTRHDPATLTKMMSLILPGPASFATVIASQRQPDFGVYLVNLAVFSYLFMVTDIRGFLNPRARSSLVNDQYLLISREAYEGTGTHAAVREFSSNDASFGYLAKLKGYLPLVVLGGNDLQTTMFTTPVRAFRNWSRSLVNGAWTVMGPGGGSAMLMLVTLGLWLFWMTPWLNLLGGLTENRLPQAVLGGYQMLAVFVILWMQNGRLLKAVKDLVFLPLSALVFMMMAGSGLTGAWIRRGTVQKGRVVPTRKRLPPWNPEPPRPRKL